MFSRYLKDFFVCEFTSFSFTNLTNEYKKTEVLSFSDSSMLLSFQTVFRERSSVSVLLFAQLVDME
jgi:hypothetical protein